MEADVKMDEEVAEEEEGAEEGGGNEDNVQADVKMNAIMRSSEGGGPPQMAGRDLGTRAAGPGPTAPRGRSKRAWQAPNSAFLSRRSRNTWKSAALR